MDLKFEFADANDGAQSSLGTMEQDDLDRRAIQFANDAVAGKSDADLVGTAFSDVDQFKEYYKGHFYKLMASHFNIV